LHFEQYRHFLSEYYYDYFETTTRNTLGELRQNTTLAGAQSGSDAPSSPTSDNELFRDDTSLGTWSASDPPTPSDDELDPAYDDEEKYDDEEGHDELRSNVKIQKIFSTYLYFIIAIFGVLGNSLALWVWVGERHKSTTTLLFMYLAISDNLFLIAGEPIAFLQDNNLT
jgi:hypothetical protein